METVRAMENPMVPPISTADIVGRKLFMLEFSPMQAAPQAKIIPKMPQTLPLRALSADESPFRAKIKQIAASK
jgi:hypothetical protein